MGVLGELGVLRELWSSLCSLSLGRVREGLWVREGL